jgi:hypothetical protein
MRFLTPDYSCMKFHPLPLAVIFAAATIYTGCTMDERVTSKDELFVYLDSLERQYETACFAMGIANWNSYSKEGPAELDSAKVMFANLFLDPHHRRTITEWRDKSSSLADERLARRLELWHRCFIGGTIYADPEIAALENALQKRITDFRFTLDGKPITRAEVGNRLRQEANQRRRHLLWQVPGQLSARTKDDLVRLIKLRNERGRALGFPNYYSLSLYLQAIDEGWLVETLTALEEQTRAPFEVFIEAWRKKKRLKEFGPWDFDVALREAASLPDKYFRPDSVFTILHRFQESIGFPVDSLPIKEVVKDIPYGGLSLAIVIPTDSRFLVNPTRGKGFYEVAFHEYGHSLQAVYTKVESPILKGYEWIPGAQCAAYAEGIAELHKEFTDDQQWLSLYTKAKPREIEKYLAGRGLPILYRLRRLMKDFFIEYELYKDPDQDAAALEREMFEKFLLVKTGENDPHLFASSIWYTSYPCYYQNYILAAMIATQLQEALNDRFGEEKLTSPDVSRWIVEHLYSRGEASEWNERIREATGKALETGAYLRKMGIVE